MPKPELNVSHPDSHVLRSRRSPRKPPGKKIQTAKDAWNSRDSERVSLASTVETEWCNRAGFVNGRAAAVEFFRGKWSREPDYRLRKELWTFQGYPIAVRFEHEFHDAAGQWWRAYGNANREFEDDRLMRRLSASINDLKITEAARQFRRARTSPSRLFGRIPRSDRKQKSEKPTNIMSRITALDPTTATGKTAELFTGVKSKLGLVPNLLRTFGHSPATLEAYLGFSGTLATGVLPPKTREQIALAVAETNACDYCLAAHSLIGQGAGLTPEAILDARRVTATDPKTNALLKFAAAVVETRGLVSDGALAQVRTAGASDAEIIETVAHVALNILTNYTNHVAQTVVDFPKAAALPVAV